MMIPNYEFKQTHPIYDTNLLDSKGEWSAKNKGTVTKEIHNILVQKILHYPDVMKHQTNVKANMTDWHMHMKDPHFRTLATLVEEIAKEKRVRFQSEKDSLLDSKQKSVGVQLMVRMSLLKNTHTGLRHGVGVTICKFQKVAVHWYFPKQEFCLNLKSVTL